MAAPWLYVRSVPASLRVVILAGVGLLLAPRVQQLLGVPHACLAPRPMHLYVKTRFVCSCLHSSCLGCTSSCW